jgi:DNA polymerase-3 subunit chi
MSELAPRVEWWFYHLTRSELEKAAGPLLQKCLDAGWRVLAVSDSQERRAKLDEALWTYDDASFLPHGDAAAPGLDASRQPVLIHSKLDNLNLADVLLLMDGMEAPVEAPFRRCLVIFDDRDQDARGQARLQFKAAKDAGLAARYFQEGERGGWKEAGGAASN